MRHISRNHPPAPGDHAGRPRRSRLATTAFSVCLLVPLVATATPAGASPAPATGAAPVAAASFPPPARQIDYREWTTDAAFTKGRFVGTRVTRGTLTLARPIATTVYDDPHGYPTKRYDLGRWLSPWSAPGFAFTELVPSWDARTPGDSFIQVSVRGRSETGRLSKWYTMANWAANDTRVHRTSLPPQTDDLATVATDTLRARYSMGFTSWQLRLTLLRRSGTTATPVVDTVGAMTSRLPQVDRVPTSPVGVARGLTLNVPRYSQRIHEGDYPRYAGGGASWCSPTSVSMVLGYYGALPPAQHYAWVRTPHPNRFVDHAARMTYDYRYRGAGNWPFSVAYGAGHAGAGFVTRLRSVREAEQFLRAGIPVVASVRFGRDRLTGSPIRSSTGHLLVIVGITAGGDVVVNDPAARYNSGVRRVYDRGQFENAWIPGSGGLSYIIRPDSRRLPSRTTGQNTNW